MEKTNPWKATKAPGHQSKTPHFFLFRPATPPANLPRLLKLDLGLCPCCAFCPGVTDGGLIAFAGLPGRSAAFLGGTGGGPILLSVSSSISRSSPRLAMRWVRRARSCVALNRSSSSVHLTVPSSRALSRFVRSKLDVPEGPEGALGAPTSELFCLKWLRVGEEVGTYVLVRGAMWR